MSERILLRGGTVFDGSGGPGIRADVFIENGKVREIAPGLDAGNNVLVYDCEGMWVMPGFVDIHTHYDAEVEVMPSLSESLRHGVTTVMIGSCGLSMVCGDPEDMSDMFTRVEGIPREHVLPLVREIKDWDTPAEYLAHLEGLELGPNLACMLGYSTVRAATMGLGASLNAKLRPRPTQLAEMQRIFEEAMDAGYVGLSISCLTFDKMDGSKYRSRPTPSTYAPWGEFQFFMKRLRRLGRVLQCVPSFSNLIRNLRLFWESAGIGRPPLKVSSLALLDTRSLRGAHRFFGGLCEIVNNRLNGDIRMQALPEVFDLWVDGLEAPVFEEFEAGTEALHIADPIERRRIFEDAQYRAKFRRDWENKLSPRAFHRNLKHSEVLECPDASLIGKSFIEIAADRRREPLDAFLDLMHEHGNDLRWLTIVGNDREDELAWIVRHPGAQIGFSDAGAHLRNMAHYNFGLRMLKLCLERERAGKSSLTTGEAVRRVTGELADWYQIDAGSLAPGQRADIAVVDPERLDDSLDVVHEAEMEAFAGLKRLVRRNDATVPYVFVNGQCAWGHGKPAGGMGQGSVLRATG